jgi:hypothetical protein
MGPGHLRDCFDQAISLPPTERVAFLHRACHNNDAALRSERERLLAPHERAGLVSDTKDSKGRSSTRSAWHEEVRSSLKPGARLITASASV